MPSTEVVSFRIPRELRERMREVDVNWSEEIRRFIEAKVREHARKRALEEIDSMLEGLPAAERGTAARYVREDREGS